MEIIKIYDSEIKDGLEKSIAKNTTTVCSQIKEIANPELIISKASIQDVGLFHIPSILASVGWNQNTDVFTPEDSWNARATPVNKPFNYMHIEDDIIGHTIASYVFTQDGTLWTGDEPPNEPFDIVDDSVIYTIYENEDNRERIAKLIAEIKEGKWFVSMECVFPDFDYALKDASGNEEIVQRNKDTAFLTKYLAAYGGTGKFHDRAIGRVLRNFVFSGKGLVDNPANKRSKFLTINQYDTESGENMEIQELEAKLAETKASHDSAVANVESLTAEKSELAKANEDLSSEVETLKATVEELTKEIASLKESLSAKVEEATSLATALETGKAEILRANRSIKLVRAGINDGEEAETILTKYSSVSEEIFDDFVALHAAKKTVCKDEEKMDKKAKCEETEEAKAEEAEALEEIETEDELAMASAGSVDNDNELLKSVASWIQENVIPNKRK